ncbi:hypothetical protein ACXC9Q_25870 (plasmid) [Kribbella sp. CWNU-51]
MILDAATIGVVGLFGCASHTLMSPVVRRWRIKANQALEEEGPVTLEENQRERELVWMTVGMNITAVVAGAYAGIGGALFVDNGTLHWPKGSDGIAMIAGAAMLVLLVGIIGLDHLTRPWHRWIDEAGALRQRLRQMSTNPELDPHELQMAEATLRRLRHKHFHSRRFRLLLRLGVIDPEAARDWRRSDGRRWDPARLSRGQVLRFSLVGGTSSGYLVFALLWLAAESWYAFHNLGDHWWIASVAFLVFLAVPWSITLISVWPELVLENRRFARERVWLAECRQRLHALQVQAAGPAPAPPAPTDRVWIQVGSWLLVRRRGSNRNT